MQGFVELTLYSDSAKLTIALHAIGKIKPHPQGVDRPCTNITLSFGSSGIENFVVKEPYEVLKLMKEAQQPPRYV
jgi:hypothetical protein